MFVELCCYSIWFNLSIIKSSSQSSLKFRSDINVVECSGFWHLVFEVELYQSLQKALILKERFSKRNHGFHFRVVSDSAPTHVNMSRLREVKSVFLQQLLTSLRSELFGHLERKVSQYQQEMDRNQKLLDSVREGSFKFRMLGYAKQSSLTLATAASCYRCFCSSVKLWFNMKYKKVLSQNGGRSLMSVDRTCSVFMKQQKSNKQVCIYI